MKKFEIIRIGEPHLKVKMNFLWLGRRIKKAQYELDGKVWDDVQKYMPIETNNLISQTNAMNVNLQGQGKVYLYPPNSDYGHYQYEGVLYVDPVYNVGAFFSPTYGFWSRPDVTKIPSERKLNYSNPNARDHWGRVAINNHRKEWIDLVKRTLRGW